MYVLFDMERTVMSFRRLLLSVSARECHYLQNGVNPGYKKNNNLIFATFVTSKLHFE